MSESVFTVFKTDGQDFSVAKLSLNNIEQVAEDLGGSVFYENGNPRGLTLGFGLEAKLDEFVVLSDRDLLITDHETFDFFFHPHPNPNEPTTQEPNYGN